MSKKTARLVENESQEKTKNLAEIAEKELQEEKEQKEIALVKRAIKQTLEEIRKKEKERNKLNKEIKILKQDIDNIRAGRLDLIEERQSKDDEAKRTSIIEIIKEKEIHHHHYHDRWYEPYRITFKYPDYYIPYTDYNIAGGIGDLPITTIAGSTWTMATGTVSTHKEYSVTNSVAKNAVAGTYKLVDGDCITIN